MPVKYIPKLFDAHFHIIDPRFPLQPNNGFLPEPFTVANYLERMVAYNLQGGAVVSGSFQGFDQTYLMDALAFLGSAFVGVTQLPVSVSDDELIHLDRRGVRALRFNLQRGGSEGLDQLERFARRVHECVGWHVELYADSSHLGECASLIKSLPCISVDHLGLSKTGLPILLDLAEHGVRVKATGFGRLDFDVPIALRDFTLANPESLMFGSDLPSTRAPIPYQDTDFEMIAEATGWEHANRIYFGNAMKLYRLESNQGEHCAAANPAIASRLQS